MDKYDESAPPEARASGAKAEMALKPVFEPGTRAPDGSFVFIRHPPVSDVAALYELTLKEIGTDVTSIETVLRVYAHNPMALWALYRCADEARASPSIAGFFAYLPLNRKGHEAHNSNTLDTLNPGEEFLARSDENPAALYLWGMVTPGLGNLGFALFARALGPDRFERTPIIGRITTQSSLDSVRRSSKTRDYADAKIGSTFTLTFPEHYVAQMRTMAVTEGKRPQASARRKQKLEAFCVSTPDQMTKALALRAAVFMIEQKCPYEEEFDGNDFAGAHVLGLVDGEPAAVMRIRYFGQFAKLERLAVLQRYRHTLITNKVIETAIELARRKGFRRMYAQVQTRLHAFWKRYGFRPRDRTFVFSDYEYVEIEAEFPPHPDELGTNSDPLVLIRPEGDWDRPGVLDRSALRPPAR